MKRKCDPQSCGDVLDRFPCQQCGARAPGECVVPMEARIAASEARRNRITETAS